VDEVNGAKYIGITALATVVGALLAYFLVPESNRFNAPLMASAGVVVLGSYGCCAWLLLADKSDFVGSTSDWFMACVMSSTIGGLGVVGLFHAVNLGWLGLLIAVGAITRMILAAFMQRRAIILSKYSHARSQRVVGQQPRAALFGERSSV
jgi:hypothetical protein